MRSLSVLFLACSLAACGGGSSATTAELDTTSGSETQAEPTPQSEASAESRPTGDAPFVIVSVDDVAQRMAQQDAHLAIFDANSRETYDQHHVPGATWVHYDAITADVLPTDTTTALVFYCANESCSASHTAATAAAGLGYTNVSVMGAGIEGWISAGKPVEGSAPAATPAP